VDIVRLVVPVGLAAVSVTLLMGENVAGCLLAGWAVADRLMVPVNPFKADAVIVRLVLDPLATTTDAGLTVSWKCDRRGLVRALVVDDSGDGVRPWRDGLALLVDLFPVEHSDRQCLAGLDGDDGYDLGAGCEGRRHVSIDQVAGGVGDLELEAAAGVCEGECCGLGSLVCRVKLDVYSVTRDVGVLVCYDSIDDVRV